MNTKPRQSIVFQLKSGAAFDFENHSLHMMGESIRRAGAKGVAMIGEHEVWCVFGIWNDY